MATAYAALVSVMQIIDQLQRHPRPPISDFDKQQVQSLTEIVTSLQQFMEAGYNNNASYSDEADPLEMRIADAAHAVEDVIESHIVDRILADREDISAVDFYRAVQKVIDDMELVKKEAMDVMKEMKRSEYQLPGADSSTSAAASSLDGPEQYTTMVGFDDILFQVLDKLTSQGSRRHVISITGMGGMGKSTLAKNVYQHELVAEHFDFLAWVTVSQQYKIRKLLLKILEGKEQDLSQVDLSQVDEAELGHILHKKLYGRRYLIVMDDIWDIQVWDGLRVFLPDNNNGSRIMITTRLSNLARQIDDSHNMIEMSILDEDNSWELFCKHVFGEEDCPLELQRIGKQIVEGCKGLPLSISVVGGLLAKSKQTEQYWEHIAENLNSTVNLEGDKHCLHLLYMSYNHLPVHLKPCFLYMGLSEIDDNFHPIFMVVSFLIGEGFVKPISGKSLEEAAKEYVIELIERNLILVDKRDTRSYWMYKECRIHDLLKDLCLRESQKQGFVYVVGERSLDNIPHSIDSIRRIFVVENPLEVEGLLPILESAAHLRSLLANSEGVGSLLPVSSRLLRVDLIHSLKDVVEKVNLRVITMGLSDQYINRSSVSRFWNLQMICAMDEWSHDVTIPYEIWMMPQLRSIYNIDIPLSLPDPPSCEMVCNSILGNLHTLLNVNNFKCSDEVVKRIPHVICLAICYTEVEGSHDDVDYCLNNLGRLQELELLDIWVQMQSQIVQNQIHDITFPRSLLILRLSGTTLRWDDVTTKIGSLPHLQVLYLLRDSCLGANWETLEGQFCSLRFLSIIECGELEYWMTESTHFPRLQELRLDGFHKLKEIPSSIGDIPTLQMIELRDCCDSVYDSAQRIKEEQEEFGNEDLQIKIFDDEYKSQREISLEDETENED